jgi:hypothetical protein
LSYANDEFPKKCVSIFMGKYVIIWRKYLKFAQNPPREPALDPVGLDHYKCALDWSRHKNPLPCAHVSGWLKSCGLLGKQSEEKSERAHVLAEAGHQIVVRQWSEEKRV